jgi:predicted LPLAT superfamily acyltransferase
MTPATRHWASLGESTFVAGTWLLWGVYRLFGRTLFRLCLFPVVVCYWAANPKARTASLQYLQRVQTVHGAIGHAPGWRDTLRHFLSFGETLLDKLLAVSGRYPFERVRLEGEGAVLATMAAGRGAVIVTAHVGCLELCRALADHHGGFALTVLVHTAHAERFNRILRRLDPGSRVRLLQVSEVGAATAVLLGERIARGELVAIVGDRVPVQTKRTTTLPFLGVDAQFPVGAYVLAALLQCPLFFMACVREAGTHVIAYERLAERVELPRGRRDEALRDVARRFARSLEAIVRRAPFEWFNFFPFWDQGKATPDWR